MFDFLHFFQLMVVALSNPELLNGQFGIKFPEDYISPKVSATIRLLTTIKENGEKALIFADRKHIQLKLREKITEVFGIVPNIINSNTSTNLRDQYTSPFRPDGVDKEGFDVLILSPRCAGFGLNLVKANHVIHYLRSFNPAVENQATDRIYRIGQTKPVSVHMLVSVSNHPDLQYTLEEKLDELIQRKQELLKDYLYSSRVGRVTEEEIAKELGFDSPGMAINDVDNLDPREFEAFIAELFRKEGFQTSLTPNNDYGADCIAVGHDSLPNSLIQCKKKKIGSKGKIGNNAIQEIVGAKPIYDREKQVSFDSLIVATNGYFTDQAKIQARSCNVELLDRHYLIKELSETKIFLSDFESNS